MFEAKDLFDLRQTAHAAAFEGCNHAWEILPKLAAYVLANVRPELRNHCEGRAYIGQRVFIGEGTLIEDSVMIKGPAIIGRNCRIRHNAYIREHVIIGDDCLVGNSCELKNAFLFNGVELPRFNYAGDSVLGHKARLGTGAALSNQKLFDENVTVDVEGEPFDTGLSEFGALVGDLARIGCNAVLNPGSVIGRNSVIYPNTDWRGILPNNMIVKNKAVQDVAVLRPRGI